MGRPLRVCHLIKGLGRGGAERLLPQLARAADGRVAYSVGYFLPHKDALVAELESAGAPVTCFAATSAPGIMARVPAVRRWLRQRQADLLHAHLPLAGVAARLAALGTGVPVVYTEHNLQERYHPLTRRANLATWRLQRAAVAVSAEVADSIARYAAPQVPVRLVRNGIEVLAVDRQGSASQRAALGIPEAAPVIGTVAVFRVQKRLDLWLAAARRIADRRPDAHFVLVGDGPLATEVAAQTAELGLTDRVHLPGLQERVERFLALFDVYLMTSQFEGLPLALLEAMAAELAVAVTAVGGIPEVVDDGETGILRPFGDTAGLADEVVRLLDDGDRRRTLGRAARRRVESRFGVRRMAAELEEVYRAAVGEDGGEAGGDRRAGR